MAALNWCLAFPYCPNEPIRAKAFAVIEAYYTKHFPSVPHYTYSASPVGEPFNRAATRNGLVRIAEKHGHDIVCLIDADTLIHHDEITRMLEWVAADTMRLGKPFMRGVNLPLADQQRLANGEVPWPYAKFNDPGAAWIVRPADWWTAGGMDENFRTWGGEDSAFSYLFEALGGTANYGTHAAVKTEHEQPRWGAIPGWHATLRRELVTKHIWQHPHLAAEWLTVRDQPGVVEQWVKTHGIPMRRR